MSPRRELGLLQELKAQRHLPRPDAGAHGFPGFEPDSITALHYRVRRDKKPRTRPHLVHPLRTEVRPRTGNSVMLLKNPHSTRRTSGRANDLDTVVRTRLALAEHWQPTPDKESRHALATTTRSSEWPCCRRSASRNPLEQYSAGRWYRSPARPRQPVPIAVNGRAIAATAALTQPTHRRTHSPPAASPEKIAYR